MTPTDEWKGKISRRLTALCGREDGSVSFWRKLVEIGGHESYIAEKYIHRVTFLLQTVWFQLQTLVQLASEATDFVVIMRSNGCYYFDKHLCNLLSVNSSNLHLTSHRCQDVVQYWSNFRRRRRVPVCNALVRGEAVNSGLQNLALKN